VRSVKRAKRLRAEVADMLLARTEVAMRHFTDPDRAAERR
jgi:hypothetical protein